MKFIHTSDWHIGSQLYGFDRLEEQGIVLDNIINLAKENEVDALLVCGDVFDTTQPSTAAQHLLASKLIRLRDLMPEIEIIVTSGNHDSATRHEALAPVWLEAGVKMIGTFRSADSFSHNIIEIPGKAFVATVPYVNDRFMPDGAWQGILDAVRERNREGLPVILMAHLTVAGADWGSHDRYDNYVGGIEIRALDALGHGYDYLALGHIHTPQAIGRNARYSGSPVALGFSEMYPHSVCLVEIANHGVDPEVTLLDLPEIVPLVDIPAKGSARWKDVMKQLAELPADRRCYLRLKVDEGTAPTDWRSRVTDATKNKAALFCTMATVRHNDSSAKKEDEPMSFERMRRMRPEEIAGKYLSSKGVEMDEELTRLFAQVMADVEQKNREE